MDYFLVFGLLLVQIGSWSTMYGLGKYEIVDTKNLTKICYGLFAGIPLLTYLLFRRGYRYVDILMYVFSFFGLGSLMSLSTALEQDGFIPKVLSSIALDQMPLLKTAHAVAYLYWNGVVDFVLGLACIVLYTCRKSHREVGLFWAGSVLNGLAVMVPAGFCYGKGDVKLETYADAFFCLIPLLALINMVHNAPPQARTFLKSPPIWKRPVDLLFFIYFAVAVNICCIRAMAIHGANVPFLKDYLNTVEPYLNDPSGAPKFQVLTYDYLYGTYYIFTMYGLWYPGQHWMADFSLVTAGASAQAQFTTIAGALNSRTPKALRPATGGKAAIMFWAVNGLLLVVPQLFALWTQRDYEAFGRTQTVEYACPVRKRVYKIRETRETVTTRQKVE